MRTTSLPRLFIAIGATLALVGCGSSGGSSSGSSGGSSSGSAAGSTPPSVAPIDGVATTIAGDAAVVTAAGAPVAGEPGPICDSIPSLDVISSLIGEPIIEARDLSSPSVEIEGNLVIAQRCEANGGAVGTAIFERSDLVTGAAVLAGVGSQGLAYDGSWPALPGAVAWANGITIEHEGLYYTATAITGGTVGQQDAPAAYEASAALLTEWLGQ